MSRTSNQPKQTKQTSFAESGTSPTDSLQLLTSSDVSRLLKISGKTIQRKRKDGSLPFVMLGGTVRFRRSAIAKLLDASAVAA